MCLSRSKRSQADEVSTSKTPKTSETEQPMAKITECPESYIPCNSTDNRCSGFGQCCYKNGEKEFCKCEPGRRGSFCQSPSFSSSQGESLQGTQAIAAFSALIGVIVIVLFLALVALQIKYYRERKKRPHADHEQNKISRPDASDRGSKKILRTQPGYSWRESVRRTGSKAANKFRNTLSNSVPDDLFGVGVKLAIFGGFKPSDHQSTVDKGEAKAVITDLCFSAGPELGDRQVICDQKDNANDNSEPISDQMQEAAAAAATATGEAAIEHTIM